jgi:hypothetical protein
MVSNRPIIIGPKDSDFAEIIRVHFGSFFWYGEKERLKDNFSII